MAARAKLTYDLNWYTPSEIKAKLESGGDLEKEVRREYTRLRDISQKRLKRLAAAGYTDTEIYQRNYKHYPKLKDIKSNSELSQRLSDLSRFVGSSQSTVKGIKERNKQTLETLKEHGYGFVNEYNLRDFGDFMEQYRDQLLDMDYDSGDAAELYRIVEKHGLDPDKVAADFEFWMENLDVAMKLRKSKKTTGNYEAFYDKAKASRKAKR